MVAKRQWINVSLNITYRCNARCRNCDRLSDVLDMEESDITFERLEQLVKDLRSMRRWRRTQYLVKWVKVTGGEPTVHPKFAEIMEFVDRKIVRARLARNGRLVTNRTHDFTLPSSRWNCYGVSVPSKVHVPFGVSPADLGIASKKPIKHCDVQSNCGIGYDYRGWSFCQVAPNLGRLLGIDPHSEGFSMKMDKRICDHCIYSLDRSHAWLLKALVDNGRLETPTDTIADALRRDPQLRRSAARWLGVRSEPDVIQIQTPKVQRTA